ncbi:MAG: hypothetical protein KDA33_08295, partial [Phycisphaerales bacterium]|nr:hypothetical protein [Phycisphaerales bacterium]
MAGITLIGCGAVGTQVAQRLATRRDHFSRLVGEPLDLVHIVVRDTSRPRDDAIDPARFTTDMDTAIADPNVSIVCELMGGIDTARRAVEAAIAGGKHVVTANKALLAEHGAELFAAARKAGVCIAFEGAV